MRSRSLYFVAAVVILGIISGLLYSQTVYKQGLDVQGGVRLTYQVVPGQQAANPKTTMLDTMAKVKTILLNRVSSVTGVVEANVILKGSDQVIVELPGYADDKTAAEQIGTSASLKAYWAKTVNPDNPAITFRPYSEAGKTNPNEPSVDFEDTVTHNLIKVGTPEYKKMLDSWELLVTGDQLDKATAEPYGAPGSFRPAISFNADGGEKLRRWSQLHLGQGEKLAFVLDDKVLQIAPVKKDATLGQDVVVDGSFKPEYVRSLVNLLNAGALPVDLKPLSSEKIDPTIGKSALNKMVTAGAIAFAVIAVYLVIYYAFPGLVALIALMLYVLFTLTVLKMIGATFSLAAIAGFVLSVGMAVDANILVFERFKEEIKRGKPLHNALQLGFSRALPAIIDSNACSILTSLVLLSVGTGPVKGFATTLIIGVAISLFTAVTVTRSLLFFLTDSGIGNNVKMYGLNRNWFGEHLEGSANSQPLQIVNNTRKWFAITAVVVFTGLVFIGLGGLKPNVEFTGGFEAVYNRTAGFPTSQQIEANLAKAGIRGSNVKFGGDSTHSLAYLTIPGTQLKNKGTEERNAFVAKSAGLPESSQPVSFSEVSPTIQKETTTNAIVGLLGSFALIVLYLAFRFGLALGSFNNGLRFGASAIAAGLKDVLVILGVAAMVGYLLGWEISSLFITAILTVIGFTVHDKIVIFDRVRENLRAPLPDENFEHLMNRSVTQSFARSINTAATVVVTLLILILFGTTTPDLKFFCLAMMTGIAWGTYSSIYTAAPVLFLWEKRVARVKGEDATLLATARAEIARNRYVRPVAVPVADGPAGPVAPTRTYGQVKRRASAVNRSHSDLDD